MRAEINILHVDDETSLLDQSKIFLEKGEEKLSVITALSAEEGLDLLDEEDIDVIVSDYQMPEMDGLEFLEEVREKREMEIPFIIFTGKGREEVAMDALNLGADRYLRKGGDPKSQYKVLADAIKQEKEHKETKNILQKTSRQFKAIFNDPTTFLGILDKDGTLLSANDPSLEFIGADEAEVEGKKFWNTPWWDHSNQLQNRLKEAVEKTRKGEYDHFEASHVGEEGKEIFVDFYIRPVKSEDGEVLSLIVEGNEITERKRMEEKLKKLYEASTKLGEYNSESEVYREVLYSAKKILDFEACTILMEENNDLEVKATKATNVGVGESYSKDEGIRGLTYQNKRSYLIDDLSEWDEAKSSDPNFKSAVSIPIKDEGVFQALSYQEGYFDESDLNLTETLISHMNQNIERIRSQEELRKRKRRYETLFEDNPGAIVEVNDEFEVVRVNEEFKDLFGYEETEIVGKNLKYHIVPSDQIDEADRLGEQCEEGNHVEHEAVRLTKDGEEVDVAITATPVKYLGERHHVIVYNDITDLRKAESQIEESKERLEKLHQASSDLETCQSREEIYTKAIEVTEDILEFDWCAINVPEKDQLVTKKASEDYPEKDSSHLRIDDSVAGRAFLEKKSYFHPNLRESKEASPTKDDYKSGITVPIGKFGVFQAVSSEEDDFDEDDLTMTELLMDHVKEALKRVSFEESLKKSERRLRSIFEESPILLWVEDFSDVKDYVDELKKKGVEDLENYFQENEGEIERCISMIDVLDVNKRTLSVYGGEDKDELLDNLDKVIPEEGLEAFKEQIKALSEGKTSFETETCNRTLEGDKIDIYLKWSVPEGYEETYSRVFVSIMDISRIKGMKEREEFLHSLLRHDVGNKCQIVDGYLQLIDEYDLPGEVEENLSKAKKTLKEGKEIIEKVRKLRKLEEKKEIGDMNIEGVLDEVLSGYEGQLEEEGINWKAEKCDCRVKGGPLLKELFSNLVENSIKHSDCENIRLESEEEENDCLIIVEDDGEGIPDELKDKIFEKGFQKGESGGSGLGLYMVKKIAEGYGGKVEVKDSELGGARFDVRLKKA